MISGALGKGLGLGFYRLWGLASWGMYNLNRLLFWVEGY